MRDEGRFFTADPRGTSRQGPDLPNPHRNPQAGSTSDALDRGVGKHRFRIPPARATREGSRDPFRALPAARGENSREYRTICFYFISDARQVDPPADCRRTEVASVRACSRCPTPHLFRSPSIARRSSDSPARPHTLLVVPQPAQRPSTLAHRCAAGSRPVRCRSRPD